MTTYAGRHRKTSRVSIERIVSKSAHVIICCDDTLYMSLIDAATGNMLGINFDPRTVDSLRRVLDRHAA